MLKVLQEHGNPPGFVLWQLECYRRLALELGGVFMKRDENSLHGAYNSLWITAGVLGKVVSEAAGILM